MSSSSAVLERVEHLKLKLETETSPCRQKTLQRHINILLDNENQRLTSLIDASLKRINANLDAFDAHYKRRKDQNV